MKFTFTIDLDCYFHAAQVGSSIYGKLLKPNDIDIAVGFKLPFISKQWVKCFRIGKYNFIVFHGVRLQDYVDNFDMDILQGYKSLLTRKLYLSDSAKLARSTKTIREQPRNDSLFKNYYINNVSRIDKYKKKIRKGWKLYNIKGRRVK